MILDYFDNEKVSVTVNKYSQAPDANGSWEDSLSSSETLRGVKYSASRAAQYFQVQIAEDIDEVFLTDEGSTDLNAAFKYQLVYGSEVYDVETLENIAELDCVNMYGLRRHV